MTSEMESDAMEAFMYDSAKGLLLSNGTDPFGKCQQCDAQSLRAYFTPDLCLIISRPSPPALLHHHLTLYRKIDYLVSRRRLLGR